MQSSQSRVWLIPNRAAPDHDMSYQGKTIVGNIDSDRGGVENNTVPSRQANNQFTITLQPNYKSPGEIKASLERLAIPKQSIYSKLQQPFDIHVLHGICKSPQDYQFDFLMILEGAVVDSQQFSNIGALGREDNDVRKEEIDVSAIRLIEYEFPPQVSECELAETIYDQYDDECNVIKAIDIYPLDNTERTIFALGGNYDGYCNPILLWSTDGFQTYNTLELPSSHSAEAAFNYTDGEFCDEYYYAIQDVDKYVCRIHVPTLTLTGTAAWEVLDVGNNSIFATPRKLASIGARYVFVCGSNGAIWRLDGTSIQLLSGGGALIDTWLQCIHALSNQHILVGGDNNTILYSHDGLTFHQVSGPVSFAGHSITTCFMKTPSTWFVGGEDFIYYTNNEGATWRQANGSFF